MCAICRVFRARRLNLHFIDNNRFVKNQLCTEVPPFICPHWGPKTTVNSKIYILYFSYTYILITFSLYIWAQSLQYCNHRCDTTLATQWLNPGSIYTVGVLNKGVVHVLSGTAWNFIVKSRGGHYLTLIDCVFLEFFIKYLQATVNHE